MICSDMVDQVDHASFIRLAWMADWKLSAAAARWGEQMDAISEGVRMGNVAFGSVWRARPFGMPWLALVCTVPVRASEFPSL